MICLFGTEANRLRLLRWISLDTARRDLSAKNLKPESQTDVYSKLMDGNGETTILV